MARPKSFRDPMRVSLTLDRKIIFRARRMARAHRRSLSEVISEILDDYFHRNGHEPKKEAS